MKKLSEYEFAKLMRTGLGNSQSNHHKQMLMFRDTIPNTHKYANWQSCPSPSCSMALGPWKYAKFIEGQTHPFVVRRGFR